MKSILVILISILIFGCSNKDNRKDDISSPIPIGGDNRFNTAADCAKSAALFPMYISNYGKLIKISSSDVDSNGRSKKWSFEYISNDTAYFYGYTRESDAIAIGLDSIVIGRLIGAAVIRDPWINSDGALQIAENNGGKVFRGNNSKYSIDASLTSPVIQNPIKIWTITYRSKTDYTKFLIVKIDASSGGLI